MRMEIGITALSRRCPLPDSDNGVGGGSLPDAGPAHAMHCLCCVFKVLASCVCHVFPQTETDQVLLLVFRCGGMGKGVHRECLRLTFRIEYGKRGDTKPCTACRA